MRQLRVGWERWLTPTQTDIDAAFRERTLRLVIPLFALSSLLQSVLILRDSKIPNGRVYALLAYVVCNVIVAILIVRQHMNAATLIMSLLFLSAAGISQTRQGYWSGYMFMIVAVGSMFSLLVFARRHALIFNLALSLQFFIIADWQERAGIPTANPLSDDSAFNSPEHVAVAVLVFVLFIIGLNTYYYREFQHRAQQVQHLIDTLEARVAARTIELKEANQRLTELAGVKDRFVSSVSHELRTPITNLKLRHHLLEQQPHLFSTHLTVIKRETQRLERIIENLLTLSRFDQRRIDFTWTQVDLNTLAQDYVDDRAPLAHQRRLYLQVVPAPAAPKVHADSDLLGQALSILLTNALNYTPPGGTITVEVGERHSEGMLWGTLAVIDSGPGIKPEERSQLFDRFFRGSAAATTHAPGTGLGLAILKEIIDQHNGRVEIHNVNHNETGACFRLLLMQTLPTEQPVTDSDSAPLT